MIDNPHPLLDRTSPKGTDFLGRCRACGQENLQFNDDSECPGPRMSLETVLLASLNPPPEPT